MDNGVAWLVGVGAGSSGAAAVIGENVTDDNSPLPNSTCTP